MSRKSEVERCEEACALLEPGGAVSFDAVSKRGGLKRGGSVAVLWSKNGKCVIATRWGVTRTEAARELRTVVLRMVAALRADVAAQGDVS